MSQSKLPDDMEIAPGYTVRCWRSLHLDATRPDSEDWRKAIEIFEARIRRRFLEPADRLIEMEKDRPRKTFGFTILAIDFLVLETLQGFREGKLNHKGKSRLLIKKFLNDWDVFQKCLLSSPKFNTNDPAGRIFREYRCALLHSGSTDGAFRVHARGPTFQFENENEVIINRTRFHENLKCEFNAYLQDLFLPANDVLRKNFHNKMNHICGIGDVDKKK